MIGFRTRFLLHRVASLLATLLVASFVIFAATYIAPGSPIAALTGGNSVPPQSVRILEMRYHLNDPFLVQYWDWLTGVLHGNLGYSALLGQDVASLISSRIWTTVSLVLYAAILIFVIGIGLGLLSALGKRVIDTSVTVVTAVFAAIPSFVAAIFFIFLFTVHFRWFPSFGNGHGFVGTIDHLTLPAAALALSAIAIIARVTRASVREEFVREHVQTAISRGIPRRQLIRRHVLRNAAIPIATVSGLTIAALIAVSAIVEQVFGLNGLGSYLVQAAQQKDLPVVQGISLLFITAIVVLNASVDLLYAVLDPRVGRRRAR
jgi:peptide/nickel transport system permease protein